MPPVPRTASPHLKRKPPGGRCYWRSGEHPKDIFIFLANSLIRRVLQMRFQHCFTVDPISEVEPFWKNRRYSSLLKTCCSSVTSCYPKNSCCKPYLFQLFRAFIGEAWKLERVQCTFPVSSYTDHTKNYWGLGDSKKQTLKYIEGCSY